jgi:cell division protein FtsQ
MSGAGARRTTILKRRAGKTARLIFLAKRIGIVVAVLGALSYGGYLGFHSAWYEAKKQAAQNDMHAWLAATGFQVRDLLVDGRRHTDRGDLKALLAVERSASIFSYDPEELQRSVTALPWVKNARVERRLPDTIYVALEERVPVALWQRDGKVSLVDGDGQIVREKDISGFHGMLVVTGENAPANAPELVNILNSEEGFLQRMDIARWIGNRRWDLRLKNGITLRLPEKNPELAIRRLADAQVKDGILDRRVEAIDLRDEGRIVVQTAPGAAQSYEAGFRKDRNI